MLFHLSSGVSLFQSQGTDSDDRRQAATDRIYLHRHKSAAFWEVWLGSRLGIRAVMYDVDIIIQTQDERYEQ